MKVTCDLARVADHVMQELPAGGLDGLLPGACVNARVLHVLPSGLLVKFLEVLEATLPLVHALPVSCQSYCVDFEVVCLACVAW